MSIATPTLTNFTAGEISPRLEGRVDLSKYFNGCRRLENFHVHPHGGATRRPGFRFITTAIHPDHPSLLIPFQFNAEQTYVLELGETIDGNGQLRVLTKHGVVQSTSGDYTKEIPYNKADHAALRYAQSADTLILVHPKHPVRKLVRIDHDDWQLVPMTFKSPPEVWEKDNYPSAVAFFQQRLVLAATPNEPGTIWMSRTGDITDFRLKTRKVPFKGWRDREILDTNSDGLRSGATGDKLKILDGDGFESKDGLRGQHTDGSTRYYRYKGKKNHICTAVQGMQIPFADEPTDTGLESIWKTDKDTDKTTLNTEFWECLKPGDFAEAPAGSDPLDDDAIEVTLSGRQASSIQFIEPRSKLWIGTSNGAWTLSGALKESVTPTNIKANNEGSCGASPFRPESIGFATLYIQRSGRKIREMSYRFESDAYVSKDLTILSEHITRPGLTQMAFVQEPDSIIYCVRRDGVLCALTYEPDQNVTAWSRLVTDGKVKTITSIYNDETKRDELWAVISRTANGLTRHYIELLEKEFAGDIQDAFFVDSGLTYKGEPTTRATGLSHLAGRTVTILADGAVHPPRTVASDGSIELVRPASTIHAGLPYTSRLQPMRLEAGSQRGTAQTKKKRITKVAVRFHETLGGKIGYGSVHEPVYFRSPSVPMGRSPGAWSGDKSVNFPKGWQREGLLEIVQDQALPMGILLIVPTNIINE